MRSLALSYFDSLRLSVEDSTVFCGARHLSAVLLEASRLLMLLLCLQEIEYVSMCFKKDETCTVPINLCVTKMPMDTCIRTRKIIKCSVLIDSYLHYVYFHARDYFTKRQSTLPFRGIYVMGMEAFICIYGKLLFPKQYVPSFFGELENNLLSLEQ